MKISEKAEKLLASFENLDESTLYQRQSEIGKLLTHAIAVLGDSVVKVNNRDYDIVGHNHDLLFSARCIKLMARVDDDPKNKNYFKLLSSAAFYLGGEYSISHHLIRTVNKGYFYRKVKSQ